MRSVAITKAPPCINRISIDPANAAYRRDHAKYIVLLDGRRVPNVLAADAASGWVEFTPENERCEPIHDGGNFVVSRATGQVEIMPLNEWLSNESTHN